MRTAAHVVSVVHGVAELVLRDVHQPRVSLGCFDAATDASPYWRGVGGTTNLGGLEGGAQNFTEA